MQTRLNGQKILVRVEGRMPELVVMIEQKLYGQHTIVAKGKP